MKRALSLAGLIGTGLTVLCLTGCEWTTGGSTDDWTSVGYDWANFSGNYRASDGQVLVREFGFTAATNQASTVSTNSVSDKVVATGNGVKTEFSGRLSESPIPGSLSIVAGAYHFSDSSANQGTGTYSLNVSPADGTEGTINHANRVWTITFPAPLANGTQIKATFLYTSTKDGDEASDGKGNRGKAIYSFVVHHTGNKLQLVDSNGDTYTGYIGEMNVTGGNYDSTDTSVTPPDSANVFAQFSANGKASGYDVTIAGTLQGTFSGLMHRLTSRSMRGTFVEDGGYAADINAVAAD